MNIHAIVTRYSTDAFGLSSPQLPGLFSGSDSAEQYAGDNLLSELLAAGAPEEFVLIEHREGYYSNEGREWRVRICQDALPDARAERNEAARMFSQLVSHTPAPIDMADKDVTGEALFVIARLDDTIGWLADQLEPGVANLVVKVGDEEMFTTSVEKHSGTDRGALSPESTVRDLWMDRRSEAPTIEIPGAFETAQEPVLLVRDHDRACV